jgi:hypothetical protein
MKNEKNVLFSYLSAASFYGNALKHLTFNFIQLIWAQGEYVVGLTSTQAPFHRLF